MDPVFILDHPGHAGNIGATLRAMGNTGFTQLRLVNPRQFPHPDVAAFATGSEGLIDSVQVFDSLTAATADLTLLVATTRRDRGQRHTIMTARELGARLARMPQARAGDAGDGQRVGLLFGGERAGLTTEDVGRCAWICTIPTHADHGSLNLSQAVLLVAYELMMARQSAEPVATLDPAQELEQRAPAIQIELLTEHLFDVLNEIGFLKPKQHRHMHGSLRTLIQRAALDSREVAILRGILTEVTAHCDRKLKRAGIDPTA
ncbi:putative tRNA/rRNA methyltransferase SpoU [Magnetofaba australis IT-1]|uniref:Putative tRNA/rRNA methyltransferase SpoU n=1 Tax=Magnetofaba australis IT-1 TaxID=1434232 RepID=A0A1Y2K5U8_9PROT|nr:putative tRNA/rRNA methyltransferase SpoU [Magnetofaba australis IT-1]